MPYSHQDEAAAPCVGDGATGDGASAELGDEDEDAPHRPGVQQPGQQRERTHRPGQPAPSSGTYNSPVSSENELTDLVSQLRAQVRTTARSAARMNSPTWSASSELRSVQPHTPIIALTMIS